MTIFIRYDSYENVAEQKNQSCLPWCGIQKAVDYRIIPIDSPLPKNFPPFLALKQYRVKVQNLSDVASKEVMTSLVPKHQMHPRLSPSSLAPFCLCLSLSACNAEWACKCALMFVHVYACVGECECFKNIHGMMTGQWTDFPTSICIDPQTDGPYCRDV